MLLIDSSFYSVLHKLGERKCAPSSLMVASLQTLPETNGRKIFTMDYMACENEN